MGRDQHRQKACGRVTSRFFLWLGLGVLAGPVGLTATVQAQAYSDYPYVSDFGTTAAPGVDNALYQFIDNQQTAAGLAMEAGADGALYPTYTENGNGTYFSVVTRPFRFEAGFTYRLSVVYETDAAFADASFYWSLAAESADNWSGTGFEITYPEPNEDPDIVAPTPPAQDDNLIVLDETGLPAGEYTPEGYEFSPAATGVYALVFTIYGREDIFFPTEGSERHLRIKSIEVSQKSPYDLAMGKIVTPVSHYSAEPQTVSAWVRNDGTAAVTSFTLCYTVGAQTVVKQTFNQSIAVKGEVLVSFDQKAVLSSGSNRVRVFLTDRPAGDPLENDTATPVFVSIYDEPYAVPFAFDFGNNTLNQRWTALYDEHTDRTTWQFGTQNDKACAYIATSNTDNNARLASPGIQLSGGQTYRVRFHYTGLSASAEKLSAYMTDAAFTDESRMVGYWKDEGFSNSLERVATFFYTAAADGVYHLVLKAHSDDLSGGIAVWAPEVKAYEPTRGDFYYEFDPMEAGQIPQFQVDEDAYFIDANHNGQAWGMASSSMAYNSQYAYRGGEAFDKEDPGKSNLIDDWMVFNPIYLEAGKTYTVSYMRHGGGSDNGIVMEALICKENFSFDAAAITKTHRDIINTNVYSESGFTFTPGSSGTYLLAFRYNTEIKEVPGGPKAEDYSVYLDHIGLFAERRQDFQVMYATIPTAAQLGQREVYLSVNYRNFSAQAFETGELTYCYRIGSKTPVSEAARNRVPQGGIGTHSFSVPVDFSTDTLHELKFWAMTGTPAETSDTLKIWVKSIKSIGVPYRDLITEESRSGWRISTRAAVPSWRFVNENVYEAPYAAQTEASDAILDDYLVLPTFYLDRDTTYLLAFYAKADRERPDAVKAGLGMSYATSGFSANDFSGNTIGQVDSLTTDYRPYHFYYKPQTTGVNFLAFHSTLPIYSGSNWIDHVVVMDSVSASYSYMALTDIAYRRVTGCDEDRTTAVELEIRNDGYLAYDSVPILYQMDDLPVQTYWLENGLTDVSIRRFTLPTRWDLSKAGNHRMRVWVGMPNERDRSDDTLTVAFRADDMAQLPLGYDFENNVLPGNVEDRNGDGISWELRRNADSAYAGRYYVRYQGTGQASADDWKLPCFYAEAGEYTLDFYMSAPYASEELLEVYLLHYDETDTAGRMVQELLLDGVVSHTDYQLYQLPFKVVTGHYGVMFRIKSEADGRTLCIDNLTVAGYGLKDVTLLDILSPVQAEAYNEPLPVTVRLRNNGRVTIHDVPLVLTINGEEVQREEVPTMEGNTEMDYTFQKPIDLHVPGTYQIVVQADWVLDQRPGNNRQAMTCVQPDELDLALTTLTSPMAGRKPYGPAETLAVRIENRGRTAGGEVPIEAVVNDTWHLNGILPRINAGEAIVYTFDQTIDMSDSAWYEFEICILPATPDNNPQNDTLYGRIDGRYDKTANEDGRMAVSPLVYPNPARTVLYVEVPAGFTHLEIHSLHGIRYLQLTVPEAMRYEIPVADYPEGMYLLRLSGVSGEKTVKWIKTR